MNEELMGFLKGEEYLSLREVEGRGICGLRRFMFTVGLCYGLTEDGFSGRYCYPLEHVTDAVIAIEVWDGVSDPLGRWYKHKGKRDYWNPLNTK